MAHDTLTRATSFIWGHARLLERRVFECCFGDGRPEDVVRAVRAHQNADGGFGHALEPDLRAPGSQPLFVEIALDALSDAGADDPAMIRRACDWLESVCDENGAVGPALPTALEHPCAVHFSGAWAVTPAVNPTAGIAARLHELGIEHPWRDRATEWSLSQIETERFWSAHTLKCALRLLQHVPDRDRAAALFAGISPQLLEAEWFQAEVPVEKYCVTPLQIAPSPDLDARGIFPDEVIEAHLDDLLARQQDDGGWPIFWEAPGPAAVAEWRGRWTLDALRTLRAYGRL